MKVWVLMSTPPQVFYDEVSARAIEMRLDPLAHDGLHEVEVGGDPVNALDKAGLVKAICRLPVGYDEMEKYGDLGKGSPGLCTTISASHGGESFGWVRSALEQLSHESLDGIYRAVKQRQDDEARRWGGGG